MFLVPLLIILDDYEYVDAMPQLVLNIVKHIVLLSFLMCAWPYLLYDLCILYASFMYIYNLCTYYNTIYHYIQVFIHIIRIFIYHIKHYFLSYKKDTSKLSLSKKFLAD